MLQENGCRTKKLVKQVLGLKNQMLIKVHDFIIELIGI
jgi:hypothetical protein